MSATLIDGQAVVAQVRRGLPCSRHGSAASGTG